MFKISKARNRKGFTLIELMIVIAIIIILAAIAIPNYLRMTERARKSAIESDLKSLATALEVFKTDWAVYPADGWAVMKDELTGADSGSATINVSGKTNVLGEEGPIEYMNEAVIDAVAAKSDGDGNYTYDNTDGVFEVTIKATIGGTPTTFTVGPGGIISISAS